MAGNNVNYFEPNDYDFNVEDLCIGVKLEVSVPGRPISTSAGDSNISWQTILDDVNLFGGTDGYLSTSYSDISSLDAHSGGNKDSFGIEYINIHYNSWNFPEIDMKLVDVRGNAVMNPLESRRDDNDKTGSFLNALFTFPYPMFRLTVKGYYGRPVTYKLTVRDVRTNFNASNGNFEITVKFIGYMFGYLNDIPMQYLLIAPDINYDGKIHLLGNFSDGNGHAIPSFREFLKGVTDAIKATAENSEIGALKQKVRKIAGALKIFNDINSLVERVNIDLSSSTYHDVFKITKSGDTEFVLNTKESYENGEKISTNAQKNAIDDLKKDVKNIIDNHQKYFDDYDVNNNYRLSEVDELEDGNNSLLHPSQNDEGGDVYTFPLTVYFNYEKLKSQVGGRINELTNEKNDNDEQLTSLMGDAYQESIGWNPTIGNIFEMVFAHFKCFYENYYTCIENIKGTSSQRNLKSLSVNTDCKRIGDGNQTVPPYPLITNSNGKYEWVGGVNEMSDKYEENFFVEAIIKGATDTGEELAKTALEYDMQREFASFPQRGLPTLLSDIYEGGNGNPYEGTSYNRGENGELPTAIQVFGKRLFLRYCFNGGVTANLSDECFAKLEALSCFREHLSSNEIKHLKETCWGEGNINSELIGFIKTFTEYGGEGTSYKDLSLLYKDYVGEEHTSGATNGILKIDNSTFREGDMEIIEYQTLLFPVYEYLNANQGNLVATYQKVFPLNIPVKLNELNEASKGINRLEGKYAMSARTLLGVKNTSSRTHIYVDCFTRYNYWDGKASSTDSVNDLSAEDALFYGFCEGLGYGKYCSEKTTSNKNEISVTISDYALAKIPTLLLAYIYLLSKNEDKWVRTIDLGESVKQVITEEYLSNKKSEIINKLKKICQQEYTLFRKEEFGTYVYYYYGIEFNNDSKKIIDEILSETVTLYTLRGVYNGYGGDDNGTPEKIVLDTGRIFAKTLTDLYSEMETTENRIIEQKKEYASPDKKIAIYMTMKELYDRWKFGTWRPNSNNTTYGQNLMVGLGNFVFLDSQYDDIEQKHFVNFDVFADLVRNIVDTAKEMSVYSFLYEICKAANMTLHALPINVYDYLGGDANKMQEMFTAYPYMACEDNAMQTTYVAMYAHKPSEHLNIVDSYNSYEDDGIDFTSNATVINSNNPLPVFGVTYGMQKQRFFKNISVGSDSPKTTAHSLMSELLISKQATSGSQNLGFEAHDIFDVYASKSYTCRVEMMGNAMIMPMMYFQLNNIPLFKGGYFIINAEHNISRNGMTTTFTGVRINKNRFDLLPKDVPDIQTYMESEGGSGLFGHGNEIGVAKKQVGIYDNYIYSKDKTIIILDAGHEMTRSGKESPKFDVFLLNNTGELTCELSDNGIFLYFYKDGKLYKRLGGDENDVIHEILFYHENFAKYGYHPEGGKISLIEFNMKPILSDIIYDLIIYFEDTITLSDGITLIKSIGYKDGEYFILDNEETPIKTDDEIVIANVGWVEANYGDILGKKTLKQVYDEYLETSYKPLITTGDTTEKDSILRPLSVAKKEEYQATGGFKNQGRTRYREYWGNRKIVNEIKRQLITRGIPEDHIIIHSTQGRDAPSYESLHGNNTYSSKVNEIYDNNNGNCIMVSVHSNATTGITEENFFDVNKVDGSKYWSIFCQNNDEYIEGKGRRKNFSDGGIPREDISWKLADGIREGMLGVVKSSEWSDNGFNKFITESHIQKNISIFKKTEGGIRPLTYCKPPTVLSENFFHTNANTVRILGTKKGIELIAKAHVDGIMKFLDPRMGLEWSGEMEWVEL